jgi:hypothetical protein
MRVSQFYKLGRSQPTLDFVDVDTVADTPVFISPKALTMLPSEFGDECVHAIQNFFKTILELIRVGRNDEAERLLRSLREPNETRFGLSKGKARGRAIGSRSAHDVWEALSKSEAAKSGLLEDLEDTVLMIEGVNVDIVSDITTNIIRAPLIRYTRRVCEQYGIPMERDVDSGPLWNAREKAWYSQFVKLPIVSRERLLLVPKAIVRTHIQYDSGEYFRHFLLTYMQHAELAANTELVEVIRSGRGKKRRERRRVTKKALIRKYGGGKSAIVRETRKHPEALARYRAAKRAEKHLPLTLDDMASIYPAAHLFVECKNYGKEVGNPELDQLSGRFSPSRGQVGLLVCRSFQNKLLFMKRCIDTAKDLRGFVIALDDDDLGILTKVRRDEALFSDWKLLQDRFRALVT